MRGLLRALAGPVLVGLGAIVVGCAQEDPASYRLNVTFPSTAMAIAAEEVKFIVFDDPEPGACQRIYLKRITGQADLPPVVAETAPARTCDLAFGRPVPLEVPVGKHSILAVGLRDKQDLLVGCSDVAISSEGGDLVVTLALPGATPVPPISSCVSLRDFCTNAACTR